MAHKETVSYHEAHGLYLRTLGLTPEGKKPKFWLGRDKPEAERRAERLELLWHQVGEDWKTLPDQYTDFLETVVLRKPERPYWSDLTLAVAKAVAKGETAYSLPRKPSWSPYIYIKRITNMQRRFSVVRFEPEEEAFAEVGQELHRMEAQAEIKEAQNKLALLAGQTSGQTWHQALDAYIAHLEKLPDRTGWYRTQVKQVRRLKEHHPDTLLAQIGLTRIEEFVNFWRHRPTIKEKTIAETTARNQIVQLMMVCKWIDRSDEWNWRRPRGFEDIKQKVFAVAEDRRHLEMFELSDLVALWKLATPLVRLEMLLALNCGFKEAEIASLKRDEISLDKPYPGIVRNGKPSGNWVLRWRRKTGVYGEWSLWPETVAGIRWALGLKQSEYLLVTKSGRTLDAPSASGNKTDKIYKSWINLYKTVKSEHPTPVKYLAFKFLEKFSTQRIRDEHGGEVANLFCCHGKPVKHDALLEVYSNKPFGRLFTALEELRVHLSPMFEGVSDPWRTVRRIRSK